MNHVTTKKGLVILLIMTATSVSITPAHIVYQSADAIIDPNTKIRHDKAPAIVTGDNIYVTW